MDVEMIYIWIYMWFEGVSPDGCMHVGMDVREREYVVISAEE